jgi:hypothetical protein
MLSLKSRSERPPVLVANPHHSDRPECVTHFLAPLGEEVSRWAVVIPTLARKRIHRLLRARLFGRRIV